VQTGWYEGGFCCIGILTLGEEIMRNPSVGLSVGVLLAVSLFATSCDNAGDVIAKNKPIILKTLTLAGKLGSYEGLKRWAKSDEAAAKEAAAALSRNLKDVILPYFEGEDLKTSAEVDEFINSSLFNNLPDEVKLAIVTAAEVLDFYLPVPGSDKLTVDQRDFLKAFLTGLQEGVGKYLGTAPASVAVRNWIKG
jgi:hypothetical protein